jgi:hypothetical protein
MNLITAIEMLADVGYPDFKKYYEEILEKPTISGQWVIPKMFPFYSDEIYLNTYGQQDAEVQELLDFLKVHNLTRNKRIMELFAGDAFESVLLHKKYPDNKYYAVEKEDYADCPKQITYLKGDVFKKYGGVNIHDVVFVGPTNKSMCCIKSVKDLIATFKFAHAALRKGGYFLGSFFEDTHMPPDNNFDVDYSVFKLKYAGKYRGLWCHWGNVTRREGATYKHYYFPVVLLSKHKEIKNVKEVRHFFYPNKPESYQSWAFNTVVDVAKMVGFTLEEHDLRSPDGSFIVFKKQ